MQQEIQKKQIQHKMLATHINLNSNFNKQLLVIFYVVFVLWNFILDWYIILDYNYYNRTETVMQKNTYLTDSGRLKYIIPNGQSVLLKRVHSERYKAAVKAQVSQCVFKATVSKPLHEENFFKTGGFCDVLATPNLSIRKYIWRTYFRSFDISISISPNTLILLCILAVLVIKL